MKSPIEEAFEEILWHHLNQSDRLDPDGRVAFRQGWASSIPDQGGVYVISDLRGSLYVGRSRSLAVRFNQHFWDTHNIRLRTALAAPSGSVDFTWFLASGADQVDLEKYLIRRLMPLCNLINYRRK